MDCLGSARFSILLRNIRRKMSADLLRKDPDGGDGRMHRPSLHVIEAGDTDIFGDADTAVPQGFENALHGGIATRKNRGDGVA